MLSFLLFSIITFAKIVGSFFLFCIIFLVGTRLWFEPFKGVCKCKTKIDGKIVLITGGNSGIGLETARDLAKRGARVIIASRDVEKSEKAVANIKETTGNDNVEYRYLNLGQKDSIVKFAEDFNKEFDRLHILVNNAGRGTVKRKTTEDGIDLLMQINYVGPFILTLLLLDKLIASKPSRIVNVSSYAHAIANFNFNDLITCEKRWHLTRYCNTKLCDILWTRKLSKQLPYGVTANVLHPGLIKTNIFSDFPKYAQRISFFIIDMLYKTPLEGAQTIIHLCVSPELENATGGYYKDCKKIKPSKIAEDDDLAEELWNKTLELINI